MKKRKIEKNYGRTNVVIDENLLVDPIVIPNVTHLQPGIKSTGEPESDVLESRIEPANQVIKMTRQSSAGVVIPITTPLPLTQMSHHTSLSRPQVWTRY